MAAEAGSRATVLAGAPGRAEPDSVREGIADSAAWDAFVEAHPSGTFFHRSSWLRVLDRALPYRPHTCAAVRAGRIVGILPLYAVPSLPRGRSLVSTPLAVYGGILATDSDAERALLAHAERLGERLRARYVEFRNRAP